MARLQILELPSGSSDERPPFLLVLDQVHPEDAEAIVAAERTTAELLGACAVLVFEETVEIPANNTYPSAAIEEAQTLPPDERAQAAEDELKKHEIRQRVDSEARALIAADLGLEGTRHWDGIRAAVINLQKELAEARMWARHGYEIGQKHCGWTDHGVAPAWLTEGWPTHFDNCEHLQQASQYDEALTRVRNLPARPETMAVHPEQPYAYMDGYSAGIRDAKRAARDDRASTTDSQPT